MRVPRIWNELVDTDVPSLTTVQAVSLTSKKVLMCLPLNIP